MAMTIPRIAEGEKPSLCVEKAGMAGGASGMDVEKGKGVEVGVGVGAIARVVWSVDL